jgi:hypothetical protein
MTQFYATFLMGDDYGRRTRKTYQTEDFSGIDAGADFLSAQAAAQALQADLSAVSELDVLSFQIRYEETVTDTVTTGANVDEGATLVVSKVGSTKRANLKVPGPVAGVRNADGTINITATEITNFIANFQAAGDFLISDGEVLDDVISGRLDK